MLIPEEQWRAQRRRHLSLLRLPENPKEYLASLVVAAKQGLDAVSRALARGELTIDEGDIRLPKLEKEDAPPPVTQARMLFRRTLARSNCRSCCWTWTCKRDLARRC
jgi:hypothetical protein